MNIRTVRTIIYLFGWDERKSILSGQMKAIRFNLEAKNTLMSPSSLFPLELKGYPLVTISNFTAPSQDINPPFELSLSAYDRWLYSRESTVWTARETSGIGYFLIKPFKWITFQDKIRLIKD